jgi:hypothetical protein
MDFFSYSFGTYDAFSGFNSIGGSGYAGQNISYQGTTAAGFDGFTSNPFVTSTTTTGFTFDQTIVGTANYQIGVDYTNNAVSGFANPNTGGAQSLTLDNTYYTIQAGSDAYLTTQFNTLGSIATIQTLTATTIANTVGVGDDDTYRVVSDTDVSPVTETTVFDPNADFEPTNTRFQVSLIEQGDLTVSAADYQSAVTSFFAELRDDIPRTISGSVEDALITTQTFQTGTTTARVIGPGIDVYNNQVVSEIDVAGRSQNYYDRIQEIAFSQADGDPAFANLVRPADFGFDLATETFASDQDAEAYSLAVQQRVVDVITNGLTTLDAQLAITQRLVAQNPEIFATATVAATGETYYTLKSLFDIRQTLEEVTQDPTALQAIQNLIAAAGGDVSSADLRASTVIGVIETLSLAPNIEEEISSEAQRLIDQRVAGDLSQTGTISAAEYAQIQQDVVSSTLVQTQESTVDSDPFIFFDGGGLGAGAAEILEPIPVNTTVDVQAGGAGEEEDPPPGSIDFGPAAVDTNTDPQAGNNNTTTDVPASQVVSVAEGVGGNYSAVYDPAQGTYSVVNDDTGTVVLAGLTQNQATTAAVAYSSGNTSDIDINAPVQNSAPAAVTNTQDPSLYPNGLPYDDDGNLNPGWSLDEDNNPVFVGGDFVEPATQASAAASIAEASRVLALKNQANSQASIAAQRKQANEGDWRVKLRLAEGADYLYSDPRINENGVLWPLTVTNGVVFPYTPQISTNYAANYNHYDLTHSNYRGYFYQNSYVDEVTITATFTAQDTFEANYMLAVIHFFRSVTKMFYGQDANRGQPPPLVFLQGLGEFQFNLHPCLVRSFSYNLPNDVDYIRARTVSVDGTNLLGRRDRSNLPSGPSWLSNLRLGAAGLQPGGVNPPPAPPTLGTTLPTYVPTKLDMTITLLPTQTRSQVSKQFSLKQFANGDLVKGGFW